MVKVIDAHCGAGKTSWVIQYINEHPDRQYIYCSPLLNELDRIIKKTNVDFRQPNFEGHTKTKHFNELLKSGENIALSHSCLTNANDETFNYLKMNNYILFLDETINVLEKLDGSPKKHQDNIGFLLDGKEIQIDEYGYVDWLQEKRYPDGNYGEIESLARNNNLICIDDKILYWQLPVKLFKEMSDIYVITYQFAGSIMDCYFKYHDLKYELVSVKKINSTYNLIDYEPDYDWISKQKELIHICEYDKLNNYKKSDLSKGWFKRANTKQLKNNIRNYLYNIMKVKSNAVMWTTFKESENSISNKGYIMANPIPKHIKEKYLNEKLRKKMTSEEKIKYSKENYDKLISVNKCFVSCNVRATNDYKNRYVLVYALNLFVNPDLQHFFSKKDILINEDAFALASMLQWIYRSQIRDGKPIDIYIPSKRMRQLLIDWLDGK